MAFRAGRADETLATAGITHLVEHLALSSLAPLDHRINGSVGGALTTLVAEGSRDELLRAADSFSQALRALPRERFETERRVLKAEGERWSAQPAIELLEARYGPWGWGLLSYPEFGLESLTFDAVQAWADSYFTRGNAVVWMSTSPEGLELTVGEGERHAPPPIHHPTLPPRNGWKRNEYMNGFAAGFIVTRSPKAAAAMHALLVRIRRELRYERGVSYAVTLTNEPLTSTTSHWTLAADILQGHEPEAVSAIARSLEGIAANGPREEELSSATAFLRDLLAGASTRVRLDWAMRDELLGRGLPDSDEALRALASVSVHDVSHISAEALGSAIYLVPYEADWPASLGEPLGDPSREPIVGRVYRTRWRRRIRSDARLTVGSQGVSLHPDEGEDISALYQRTAALLRWPDGPVALYDESGSFLRLNPKDWSGGERAISAIENAVPRSRWVPMESPSRHAPRGAPTFGQVVVKVLEALAAVALVVGSVVAVLAFVLSGGSGWQTIVRILFLWVLFGIIEAVMKWWEKIQKQKRRGSVTGP